MQNNFDLSLWININSYFRISGLFRRFKMKEIILVPSIETVTIKDKPIESFSFYLLIYHIHIDNLDSS